MAARLAAACLALCLGGIVGGAPARAQEPLPLAPREDAQTLALARELVEASHAERTLQAVLSQTFANLPDMSGDPQVQAQAKDFQISLGVGLKSVVPEMVEQMTHIYARVFTAAELQDAIRFYRSPTGEAFMNKLPEVARETGPAMTVLLPKVFEAAQRDYCARRTCTAAQRRMFETMSSGFSRPSR